jgi:hypothetical protein
MTFEIIQGSIKNRLLGYEIIEQHKNSCIIKNVSNIIESEFDPLMRRIFLILLSSSKMGLEMIREKNLSGLDGLLVMKETADKFYAVCCRIIINNRILPSTKSHFLYVILWVLDRIGDDYRDMFTYLIGRKGSPLAISPPALGLYARVNSIVESFYKTYYTYKIEELAHIHEEREKLIAEIRSAISTKNETERIMLEYLLSITKRMDDVISSCIGLNMNMGKDSPRAKK